MATFQLKSEHRPEFAYSWEQKESKLVWRGTPGQNAYDNSTNIMTSTNLHLFSRVKLCELSLAYPTLIDANFTVLYEHTPKNLMGRRKTFKDQLNYKYQMLIHGNASSFSNSGWRFFSDSVVFISDSLWTQWYYNELKPYVHYVPVKRDLEDLVEKILWAKNHDSESRKIAGYFHNFVKR